MVLQAKFKKIRQKKVLKNTEQKEKGIKNNTESRDANLRTFFFL